MNEPSAWRTSILALAHRRMPPLSTIIAAMTNDKVAPLFPLFVWLFYWIRSLQEAYEVCSTGEGWGLSGLQEIDAWGRLLLLLFLAHFVCGPAAAGGT